MSDSVDTLKLAVDCGGLLAGPWRVVGTLHELYLRPHLPDSSRSTARLNGLVVPHEDPKLLDGVIGIPNYEWKLVCGMKRVVEPGDDVTVVGGGYGVSTVYAARLAGEAGSVRVYEGAVSMVENIREACEMHGVGAVTVNHSIVSEARALRGEAGDATVTAPADLPESTVLVLDCEGAEADIIPNLSFAPKAIVVETHGVYDAPPDLIAEQLTAAGYEVVFNEVMSEADGLSILVGQRDVPVDR